MEQKHRYPKINSIKVIIENKEGKVLLIQEPETDEWMPLHWGLPGGRPHLKESLYSALKRSLQEDTCRSCWRSIMGISQRLRE